MTLFKGFFYVNYFDSKIKALSLKFTKTKKMNNRKKTKGRNYKYLTFLSYFKDEEGKLTTQSFLKKVKQILPTRQAIQNALIANGIIERLTIQSSKYTKKNNPNKRPSYAPLWNSRTQGTYVKKIHGELVFQ